MHASRSVLALALVAGAVPASLSSCSHPRTNISGAPASMTVEDGYLAPAPERAFHIRYAVKVADIPAGAKRLRLWWPVPSSTNLQRISELEFSGPARPRVAAERKYGNQVASIDVADPKGQFEFGMTFRCARREVKVELSRLGDEGSDAPESFRVFREPERLVVVDDEVRRRAKKAAGDKQGTVARARGLYEEVMATMTYDKSGKGWGRGDTRYACEVGKGNCTDFHALFNALCRAEGIASGFEIGLYLHYEARKSPDWQPAPGGYHCWAAFRVPGRTWVPVDISEADRFPERSGFFFGGHTSNRVTLSVGRDITLEPRQDGEPLNYFLDPYAEVDGKPHAGVSKTWFFKDL